MVFLYLGWEEIKVHLGEQVLVLCSGLKWKFAIVAKQRAPIAKPARLGCDHWALSGSLEPTMVGFRDLVGVGIGPFSKKNGC